MQPSIRETEEVHFVPASSADISQRPHHKRQSQRLDRNFKFKDSPLKTQQVVKDMHDTLRMYEKHSRLNSDLPESEEGFNNNLRKTLEFP